MKTWRERLKVNILNDEKRSIIPEGIWHKCPDCKKTIFTKDLVKAHLVCPNCNYHFPLSPKERIQLLSDEKSFKEINANIKSVDPINFVDTVSYKDRLKKSKSRTGSTEAVITGTAKLDGRLIALAILDFGFMGGSMGSVVGEKITLLIEHAADKEIPLVIVSNSGGARMQEGILSLMQMAKTSMAINLLNDKKIPFISILANPTLGGVSASYAMLADINIAEPGALIGFAGPRVIFQTIKQELPEGFQKSEFQLKHGGIDLIISRNQLKTTISNLLDYLVPHNKN